jgi:hypothetical protein
LRVSGVQVWGSVSRTAHEMSHVSRLLPLHRESLTS